MLMLLRLFSYMPDYYLRRAAAIIDADYDDAPPCLR